MKPWLMIALGVGVVSVAAVGMWFASDNQGLPSQQGTPGADSSITSADTVNAAKRTTKATSGGSKKPRNAQQGLLGFPASDASHAEEAGAGADSRLTAQEQQRVAEFQRITPELTKNVVKDAFGIDYTNLNTESMEKMAKLQADLKAEGEKVEAYFKERFGKQPDWKTHEAFSKFMVNDLFVSFDTNGDDAFTEAEERALTDHIVNQIRDGGVANLFINSFERFEADRNRKNLAL